jgi:hypothetical protein
MASAPTYDQIAWTSLGSATATVSLTSISSAYTDLKLIINGKTSTTSGGLRMQFNSDTATNYSQRSIYANGSTAVSSRNQNGTFIYVVNGASFTQTQPQTCIMDFMSYSDTGKYKTFFTNFLGDRNGSGDIETIVCLWKGTAAISSIQLTTPSDTFAIGTTFALYGILKA